MKVLRMSAPKTDSKIKMFFDVEIGGMIIKGLKVIDGTRGLFVGMPSETGKDGKRYDVCYPETPEFKKEIEDFVLKEYNGRNQNI